MAASGTPQTEPKRKSRFEELRERTFGVADAAASSTETPSRALAAQTDSLRNAARALFGGKEIDPIDLQRRVEDLKKSLTMTPEKIGSINEATGTILHAGADMASLLGVPQALLLNAANYPVQAMKQGTLGPKMTPIVPEGLVETIGGAKVETIGETLEKLTPSWQWLHTEIPWFPNPDTIWKMGIGITTDPISYLGLHAGRREFLRFSEQALQSQRKIGEEILTRSGRAIRAPERGIPLEWTEGGHEATLRELGRDRIDIDQAADLLGADLLGRVAPPGKTLAERGDIADIRVAMEALGEKPTGINLLDRMKNGFPEFYRQKSLFLFGRPVVTEEQAAPMIANALAKATVAMKNVFGDSWPAVEARLGPLEQQLGEIFVKRYYGLSPVTRGRVLLEEARLWGNFARFGGKVHKILGGVSDAMNRDLAEAALVYGESLHKHIGEVLPIHGGVVTPELAALADKVTELSQPMLRWERMRKRDMGEFEVYLPLVYRKPPVQEVSPWDLPSTDLAKDTPFSLRRMTDVAAGAKAGWDPVLDARELLMRRARAHYRAKANWNVEQVVAEESGIPIRHFAGRPTTPEEAASRAQHQIRGADPARLAVLRGIPIRGLTKPEESLVFSAIRKRARELKLSGELEPAFSREERQALFLYLKQFMPEREIRPFLYGLTSDNPLPLFRPGGKKVVPVTTPAGVPLAGLSAERVTQDLAEAALTEKQFQALPRFASVPEKIVSGARKDLLGRVQYWQDLQKTIAEIGAAGFPSTTEAAEALYRVSLTPDEYSAYMRSRRPTLAAAPSPLFEKFMRDDIDRVSKLSDVTRGRLAARDVTLFEEVEGLGESLAAADPKFYSLGLMGKEERSKVLEALPKIAPRAAAVSEKRLPGALEGAIEADDLDRAITLLREASPEAFHNVTLLRGFRPHEPAVAVPTAIAELVRRIPMTIANQQAVGSTLHAWGEFTRFVKTAVTVPYTAFHVMNTVGNVYLSAMSNGLSLLRPSVMRRVFRTISQSDKPVAVIGGKVLSGKQAWHLGVSNGAFLTDLESVDLTAAMRNSFDVAMERSGTSEFYATRPLRRASEYNSPLHFLTMPLLAGDELGHALRRAVRAGIETYEQKGLVRGAMRTATGLVAEPVKAGFEAMKGAGIYSDNVARGMTFLNAVDEGQDAFAAAQKVWKHHFNYNDVNRALGFLRQGPTPFITFSAKAWWLGLSSMIQNPLRLRTLQKIVEQNSYLPNGEPIFNLLPEESRNRFGKVVPGPIPGTGISIDGQPTPFDGFLRTPMPGAGTAREMGKDLFESIGSVFLLPLEWTLQHDFHFDRKSPESARAQEFLQHSPGWVQNFLEYRPFYDEKRGEIGYRINPFRLIPFAIMGASRLYSTVGKYYDAFRTRDPWKAVDAAAGYRVKPILTIAPGNSRTLERDEKVWNLPGYNGLKGPWAALENAEQEYQAAVRSLDKVLIEKWGEEKRNARAHFENLVKGLEQKGFFRKESP